MTGFKMSCMPNPGTGMRSSRTSNELKIGHDWDKKLDEGLRHADFLDS